jgi:hypothetical protein
MDTLRVDALRMDFGERIDRDRYGEYGYKDNAAEKAFHGERVVMRDKLGDLPIPSYPARSNLTTRPGDAIFNQWIKNRSAVRKRG